MRGRLSESTRLERSSTWRTSGGYGCTRHDRSKRTHRRTWLNGRGRPDGFAGPDGADRRTWLNGRGRPDGFAGSDRADGRAWLNGRGRPDGFAGSSRTHRRTGDVRTHRTHRAWCLAVGGRLGPRAQSRRLGLPQPTAVGAPGMPNRLDRSGLQPRPEQRRMHSNLLPRQHSMRSPGPQSRRLGLPQPTAVGARGLPSRLDRSGLQPRPDHRRLHSNLLPLPVKIGAPQQGVR